MTRKKPKPEALKPARDSILIWWATTSAILNQLHDQAQTIRNKMTASSPLRKLIDFDAVNNFAAALEAACCDVSACYPRVLELPELPETF